MAQIPIYFDGPEYDEARDLERLSRQNERILKLMRDSVWRTLAEISDITGDPPASVSAQLRHLRKPRFGAHLVERTHVSRGLYRYRVIENLPS